MPARCKAKIQKRLTIDQTNGTIEHIHMIGFVHIASLSIEYCITTTTITTCVTTTIYYDFEHYMISDENLHHHRKQHYVIKWIRGLLLKKVCW